MTYRKLNATALVFSLLLFTGFFPANAQDGADLLQKMDNIIFAPKDKQAKVKITVNNKAEKEKIREADLKQKGADRKIYKYTFPESQAGVATLSLPGDIMWLYMPAFEKPKKISLLAKSQAFTGTDFAYEDIPTTPYSERYTPKFLKTEGTTHVLELTPKSEKSNYSKLVAVIDKTYYYPVKIEYYNKSGEKAKEAIYKYTKIGNYWNAGEVVMTDLKKGTSTSIVMTEVKFDQGLPDDEFTVEKFFK
jgi:outer membrane lipoprotein-sorting protein